MAVPLHTHTREDEVWFVLLEGEIAFTLGLSEDVIIGGAGISTSGSSRRASLPRR